MMDILIPPCSLKDAKKFIRESILTCYGELPRCEDDGQYVPHDYWMEYIDNGEETFIRLELWEYYGNGTGIYQNFYRSIESYFGESNVAYG